MHRLEANIMHHAKKQREQRKHKLIDNSWQRINQTPDNYNLTIKLYNDDLTLKGLGHY